jgi:hypothetical protein
VCKSALFFSEEEAKGLKRHLFSLKNWFRVCIFRVFLGMSRQQSSIFPIFASRRAPSRLQKKEREELRLTAVFLFRIHSSLKIKLPSRTRERVRERCDTYIYKISNDQICVLDKFGKSVSKVRFTNSSRENTHRTPSSGFNFTRDATLTGQRSESTK